MYEFGDRSSFCPLIVNITSKLEDFLEWGGKRKIYRQRGCQYIIGLPASCVLPTALMKLRCRPANPGPHAAEAILPRSWVESL
jgi:hypothetical protein